MSVDPDMWWLNVTKFIISQTRATTSLIHFLVKGTHCILWNIKPLHTLSDHIAELNESWQKRVVDTHGQSHQQWQLQQRATPWWHEGLTTASTQRWKQQSRTPPAPPASTALLSSHHQDRIHGSWIFRCTSAYLRSVSADTRYAKRGLGRGGPKFWPENSFGMSQTMTNLHGFS